jgi:Zn-dependent M16 (insulinase) family peptidase
LAIVTAKLLQDLPRRKRSANSAASSTIYDMLFDINQSPSIANGLLAGLKSLPAIAEELRTNPSETSRKLSALRDRILDPSVLRISVAGDILNLEQPRSAWDENFMQLEVCDKRQAQQQSAIEFLMRLCVIRVRLSLRW